MNPEILPKSYRILVWVVVIAVFFLILLTGYIAVQVAGIDTEVEQLRSTSRP